MDDINSDDGPDHPPSAETLVLEPLGDTTPEFRTLLGALAAALAEQGIRGEARVCVVDDAEVTRLHREHKGLDTTTDVLTFDLSEGDELDADITVCIDEARRQANARCHPVEHELLLYAVHGILHCLGENDDTDDNAKRMHTREDDLLTELGIGPIYAVPEGGA
ncbi:MAG: rRNA maturation RNase YbeY [Planctomycetota bacterium]